MTKIHWKFFGQKTRDCLHHESSPKSGQSRSKAVVSKVCTSTSTPKISSDVAELKDMVKALLLDKKNQNQPSAPLTVKAVEQSCVTCVELILTVIVPPPMATIIVIIFKNTSLKPPQQTSIKEVPVTDLRCNTASTSGSGSLPSNTIANPKGDVKAITTRSGVFYNGPQIPPSISSLPKEMENEPEVTKDTVQPSTENIQPPVVQTNDQIGEPVVASKTKPALPFHEGPTKEKLVKRRL
ncbi:hypothetical protein Tco_1002118 [Tanacetum coccineum]|uniref:Reverse transcriptase domain-containing protein n=1 Tax=Tanacetum coccineum TaxID=301880 RepID=A0ABQ5F5M7_9ASTR